MDVTVYQAANSFLPTVQPLAPEMAFQLSNFKVAWTDKMTRQFTPPHPSKEQDNVLYQLYLRREPTEESMSLLQRLRCHTVVIKKPKSLCSDKFLVAVKFLSVQNPVFFFQHLIVHHPHRRARQLRHLEEATMPRAIQFFSQVVNLCPERWSSSSQILAQFDLEGHRSSYLTTLVGFVMALHDILFLWQRQVVDSRIGSLHSRSLERLYPLSPYQTAIYQDIVDSLSQRQMFLQQGAARVPSSSSSSSSSHCSWDKYHVLLGKPGPGNPKSTVPCILPSTWSKKFSWPPL